MKEKLRNGFLLAALALMVGFYYSVSFISSYIVNGNILFVFLLYILASLFVLYLLLIPTFVMRCLMYFVCRF